MPAGHFGCGRKGSENDDDKIRFGLFEPTHGSAPDIAGKDCVNPISQWRSAILLLEYLGEIKMAETIENGILDLAGKGITTPELGGNSSTSQMTKDMVEYLTA